MFCKLVCARALKTSGEQNSHLPNKSGGETASRVVPHCNRSVTDLLIQRGPSADSVTRPVEALSQRVSSSPPFLAAVLSSVRVYATSLFQINATATLATHNVLENGFC